MYKVFIVEDDNGIATGISTCLEGWGMETRIARDFRQIMAEFEDYQPHLVLMDIALPYMDGYYWCRELRKISELPVMFISSASENMNIVMAMNMGGDDFIAKPFDLNVLVAKVQAILRRTYNFGHAVNWIEHGGACLNMDTHLLEYNDNRIELTKNEYRILLTLMENKDRVVSREKLMEALWETDSFVDENTLTVNVGRLRKKLEGEGLEGFITTKFGEGYIVGGE